MSKSGITILLILVRATLEVAGMATGPEVQGQPTILAAAGSPAVPSQYGPVPAARRVLYTECQSTSIECSVEVKGGDGLHVVLMWTDPSNLPISTTKSSTRFVLN